MRPVRKRLQTSSEQTDIMGEWEIDEGVRGGARTDVPTVRGRVTTNTESDRVIWAELCVDMEVCERWVGLQNQLKLWLSRAPGVSPNSLLFH